MVLCSGLSKFVLFCVILTSRVAAFEIAKPGCQEKCGDVSIPYPFGLTKECSLNEDYLLSCDSATTPPKVFLTNTKVEVLNISLDGYLRILTNVGRDCYNSKGWRDASQSNAFTSMYKYPVSNTRNKFVAIGCDTNARISFATNDMERVFSACSSLCYSERYVSEGTCSGTGCCETSIPRDVYNYTVSVTSFQNHANVWKFNPCSYTFVGEVDKSFKLSMSHLENFTNITVPTVLDWAVGNQTCKEAMSNMSTYACQSNSECIGPDNGYGYRCNCTSGYEGNPYLHGSCQDINECEDGKPNNCEKICINTDGGYTCKCPKSHSGDGKRGGQGCIPNESTMIKIIVDVGFGSGLLVLVICSFWLYWVYKKKKLLQLKNKYFKQNGGLMLQQQLLKQQGCTETAKIYTAEELEKATDKYDESRIVGQGGFGTVYKGILANGSVVAIKRSKLVDKNQIEQFINGVVVLYQINHRNVVRLLGCCLETEVPLLVYEYVSNGTLFDHIHVENMNSTTSVLPWNIRVRIAAQIAGVLAYLHSVASPPIIHRDVKSTNILLDENYVAKVSDFGASRLVPIDQIVLSTFVQGTLGYLDPEYLLTRQLTEKSDVYSFGVVLVELLTGKKNLCFDSVEKERSLANYILACLKQDRLHEILEESLKEEKLDQIEEVAKIAKKCLRMRGDDRPDMQEVAMRLEGLRRIIERENHQWVDPGTYLVEAPSLLLDDDEESSDIFNKIGHGGNSSSSVYDSIQDHVVLSVNDGR